MPTTTRTRPPAPPARAADPAAHLAWAEQIAHGVARRWHFRPGSQEEADIVQTAHLAVSRAAGRFDPATYCPAGGDPEGLFRGWCRKDVVQECQREARRLLNAGTYRTRREWQNPRLVKGYSFSDLAAHEQTAEYDLPDPEAEEGRPNALSLPDADPAFLFDTAPDPADPAGTRHTSYGGPARMGLY